MATPSTNGAVAPPALSEAARPPLPQPASTATAASTAVTAIVESSSARHHAAIVLSGLHRDNCRGRAKVRVQATALTKLALPPLAIRMRGRVDRDRAAATGSVAVVRGRLCGGARTRRRRRRRVACRRRARHAGAGACAPRPHRSARRAGLGPLPTGRDGVEGPSSPAASVPPPRRLCLSSASTSPCRAPGPTSSPVGERRRLGCSCPRNARDRRSGASQGSVPGPALLA